MPQENRPEQEAEGLLYQDFSLPQDDSIEPGLATIPPVVIETAAADSGTAPPEATSRFGGGVIRAALIISVGNVLTRIFGLGRETVLAAFFGTAGPAAAFTIADNVLTIFFDLLVSGAISSALIPVLSRYAARQGERERAEFWHIVNTLLTLGLLFLLVMVGLLQLVADPLAHFMANKESAANQNLAVGLVRVILFGIVFLGVSSIMMATLQALQRFTWSALSLAARNATVIVVALLFSQLGVWSLVIGVVLGTFMLIVLQAPGLRDMPLRPSLDWRHPAVREILRLYGPICLGLVITSGVLIIDRALADSTGLDSLGAMRYATTLQQFTLGLVGSAISIAILPTLSRQAASTDLSAYRHTLMSGLKLLMVLIIPATLGLLAISLPTIRLIYERGHFSADSTVLTLVALLGYLPGIPAAAIDQMLIFSFYARKNTLTPVLVGVFSNLSYLGLALLSVGPLHIGMIGLVLANSLQQVIHMTVMLILLRKLFGRLSGEGLPGTTLKTVLAALLLCAVAFLASGLVNLKLGNSGLIPNLAAVVVGVSAGGLAYLFALRLLKVGEMDMIWAAVARKIRRA